MNAAPSVSRPSHSPAGKRSGDALHRRSRKRKLFATLAFGTVAVAAWGLVKVALWLVTLD